MKKKKYHIGMYAGKFMPFHKGHEYCLRVAASECDIVYVIMFHGGFDEKLIRKTNKARYLSFAARKRQVIEVCKKYSSIAKVVPCDIDTSKLEYAKGPDNWDCETPLVRAIVGNKLDAVYGSEVSYGAYFKRAYPEAVHRLVDPPRIKYPISGTKIRNFENEEERKLWMV